MKDVGELALAGINQFLVFESFCEDHDSDAVLCVQELLDDVLGQVTHEFVAAQRVGLGVHTVNILLVDVVLD